LAGKFRELFKLFKGTSAAVPLETVEVVGRVFKYTRNLIAYQK
jgi:hypothetical protein